MEEIALDPASETSVSLLKLLLAQRGLNPRLVSWHRHLADATARLLIGDQAIRFRQEHSDYRFWDLGQEWKTIVDLPFVYALWLVTPGFGNAKEIAGRLRSLRDENLARIDKLIAEEKEFGAEFCRRYYRQHLRFSFGERERQGLLTFADACAKHGFISKGQLELDLV